MLPADRPSLWPCRNGANAFGALFGGHWQADPVFLMGRQRNLSAGSIHAINSGGLGADAPTRLAMPLPGDSETGDGSEADWLEIGPPICYTASSNQCPGRKPMRCIAPAPIEGARGIGKADLAGKG